ncbi:MAG: alpha/beta fold hydrolase [Cyanobacteria bacterium P01_E01_bin.48]
MPIPLIYNDWLIASQPAPKAPTRLFCFPFAGGTFQVFRDWHKELPDTLEVIAVELPGRGRRFREPLFTQIAPLVEALSIAIEPYLDRPFFFFGHSLGGLVSFELTRLLRRKLQVLPEVLFISARRAPTLTKPRAISHLSDPEFIEEISQFNGTPSAILESDEFSQIFLPILRADFSILDNYVYAEESPLDCPIITFGGQTDREVSRDDLGSWNIQTTSNHELHMLPGDHFFINSSKAMLLAKISQYLQRA